VPIPRKYYEELQTRRAEEARDAHGDLRRDLMLSALLCWLWAGLGILLILWSAHTTNMFYGRLAFVAGIGIGNGGVIFTLLGAYRRGEKRGDW
jgi:hypothetical protein